jgi:signal transduction histidine kinase
LYSLKIAFSTFFLMVLSFNVVSQKTLTVKADSLLKIAKSYIDIDLDSSIIFTKKAIIQSKFENDSATEAKCYINLGLCNDFSGNYPGAIKNYKIALEKFTAMNDYKGMGIACNVIGIAYYHIADYKQVTHYYSLAIKYFEQTNYPEGVAAVLNGMGVLYGDMNENENALNYYHQSLAIKRELNDSMGIINTLLNIGDIEHYVNSNYDVALKHFSEVATICALKKNERKLADCFIAKSGLYLSKKEVDKALEFANKSLEINNKLEFKEGICDSYMTLANALFANNNLSDAIEMELAAESIAIQIDYKSHLVEIYNNLALFSASKGDYLSAYEYSQKYDSIKDLVFSEDSKRIIEDLKASYEVEKKDQQIVILDEENKVKSLKIENATYTKYVLITLALLLLLVITFIVSRYRLKTKLTTLLEQKNTELSISNASKDRIFAIISHDLKGPIAAFESISSIINNNFNDLPLERIKDLVNKMYGSSQDLQSLLLNLLNWAKSQQGYLKLKNEQFEIMSEIELLIKLFANEINTNKIEITKSGNAEINADKEIVKLILRNILQNAVKFTKDKIAISVEDKSSSIEIKISDNGIGMSLSDSKKLFKIEEDVSEIGNSPKKGSGIGLYLSYELVLLLKGEILVESELNKGATFLVKIPK